MYKISLDDFYQVVDVDIYPYTRTAKYQINKLLPVGRTYTFYKNRFWINYSINHSDDSIIYIESVFSEINNEDYLLIIPESKFKIKDLQDIVSTLKNTQEQLWTLLSNLDNSNTKLIESIVKML